MMKKSLILLVFVLGLFLGCNDSKTIEEEGKIPFPLKGKHVQCPQCNMTLSDEKFSAQVFDSKRKTQYFDDVGCMVLWMQENHKDNSSLPQWVFTIDSKKWLEADKAFYSVSDKTPMYYGFGAYEKASEKLIDYDEMRLKMLRGENMTNPKIRQKLLGENR